MAELEIAFWDADDVAAWVEQCLGLPYGPHFLKACVDGPSLLEIHDERLRDIGVEKASHRLLMLSYLAGPMSMCKQTTERLPPRCSESTLGAHGVGETFGNPGAVTESFSANVELDASRAPLPGAEKPSPQKTASGPVQTPRRKSNGRSLSNRQRPVTAKQVAECITPATLGRSRALSAPRTRSAIDPAPGGVSPQIAAGTHVAKATATAGSKLIQQLSCVRTNFENGIAIGDAPVESVQRLSAYRAEFEAHIAKEVLGDQLQATRPVAAVRQSSAGQPKAEPLQGPRQAPQPAWPDAVVQPADESLAGPPACSPLKASSANALDSTLSAPCARKELDTQTPRQSTCTGSMISQAWTGGATQFCTGTLNASTTSLPGGASGSGAFSFDAGRSTSAFGSGQTSVAPELERASSAGRLSARAISAERMKGRTKTLAASISEFGRDPHRGLKFQTSPRSKCISPRSESPGPAHYAPRSSSLSRSGSIRFSTVARPALERHQRGSQSSGKIRAGPPKSLTRGVSIGKASRWLNTEAERKRVESGRMPGPAAYTPVHSSRSNFK